MTESMLLMVFKFKTLNVPRECELEGYFLQPLAFRQHMHDGSYLAFLF